MAATQEQQEREDHWSAEAYQNSASFVPKLAGKVLEWLDVEPDDVILDVGCGDGIINLQIAETVSQGRGSIHGIDSSADMIQSAQKDALAHPNPAIAKFCTFEGMPSLFLLKSLLLTKFLVLDASVLSTTRIATQTEMYTKIFSNAALHWILRSPASRAPLFKTLHTLLRPSGTMVFEMGGMGNVAEMRTALLSCTGRRIGIEKAREADPWFFPDEVWMKRVLEEEVGGWKVERCEREYRPTRADEGGVEGWVRLMGKQFLDAVGKEKGEGGREECAKEVVEVLKTVTTSPGGGDWFGYVRLRVLARKI